MPGLEPDRAPVIVAGAAIARESSPLRPRRARASEHDLLDGGALEAAALPPREEGAVPPGAFLLLRSHSSE